MRTTTSISFTRDGLLNPEAVDFFVDKKMDTLAVFSDGTTEAFEHIRDYDFSRILNSPSQLAIARVPLWDLRVADGEGNYTKPNYVYSEENRIDWLCANICAPCMDINVFDIGSQTKTRVSLPREQVQQVCNMSFRFWTMLKIAEDRLCFPAIVIDGLTKESRSLNKDSIDVAALRHETGLSTLDYNYATDLLSVSVAGEEFTVKLTVLDAFFRNHILPFFNRYLGRRYRLEVSVLGLSESASPHQLVSYGGLGRIIDQMQNLIKKQLISAESPMDPEDLLIYSKKVKINAESCLFARGDQTIIELILASRRFLVRHEKEPLTFASADNDEANALSARAVG